MTSKQMVIETKKLHHRGTQVMLGAALDAAEAMGAPQCIVIVDASGELLGSVRMEGAKFLSLKSARAKARTAASTGKPSNCVPAVLRVPLSAACGGELTGMPGGLPIRVDGQLLGGIGIGSGTGDQDILVGNAALTAIGAETFSLEEYGGEP